MGGGAVPGGPGGRFHPAGRDPWAGIGDLGHDEPGDPRSDKQRRDRWDAPTVGRNTPLAAVRGTHRPVRRGKLRVAAVAVVVGGIRAGRDCGGGCARKIQAAAMAGQRELRPEQCRHREEGGALEPATVTTADHGLRLPLSRSDATDPDQPWARPGVWSGTVAFGVAGIAADLARRSALATTDTELRLIASAATIGLSGIPERE